VSRTPTQSFHCQIVSGAVEISLRRRPAPNSRGPLFVRCSEKDCQYLDANQPPCRLTVALFAIEIRERVIGGRG